VQAYPAVQARQDAFVVAPVVGEYDPGLHRPGHGTGRPRADEKEPAEHMMHTLAAVATTYWPAEHRWQNESPWRAEKVPALQLRQAREDGAAVAVP
jgi:hypothetical protein